MIRVLELLEHSSVITRVHLFPNEGPVFPLYPSNTKSYPQQFVELLSALCETSGPWQPQAYRAAVSMWTTG